jgi:hypothetical protein
MVFKGKTMMTVTNSMMQELRTELTNLGEGDAAYCAREWMDTGRSPSSAYRFAIIVESEKGVWQAKILSGFGGYEPREVMARVLL